MLASKAQPLVGRGLKPRGGCSVHGQSRALGRPGPGEAARHCCRPRASHAGRLAQVTSGQAGGDHPARFSSTPCLPLGPQHEPRPASALSWAPQGQLRWSPFCLPRAALVPNSSRVGTLRPSSRLPTQDLAGPPCGHIVDPCPTRAEWANSSSVQTHTQVSGQCPGDLHRAASWAQGGF